MSALPLVQIVTVPMTFRLLRGQAALMTRAGFEAHAISSPGAEAESYARDEQVPHHPVPLSRRIAPLADLLALWRLVRTLWRLRPAAVQAGTPKAGLLGMLAALLMRVPVRIYHVHGLPMVSARGIRRIVLRLAERVACAAATEVLCVSRSVRNELGQTGLCPARKMRVLGAGSCNGVDTAWFDPARLPVATRSEVRARLAIPTGALVVGFIGRLARDKGISELQRAWRTVRDHRADAYLLVVGPSEADDPVTAEALRELARDPRVRLTGADWNTAPLYAAMDVCCLPSYREGLPTVLLEAAAMELPVVAFRVTGVVDVVDDGLTGCLIEPFCVDAFAAALRRYLDDPVLRARHGAAGRRLVLDRFRQEYVWAELQRFYESVAARCAAGAARRLEVLSCTGRT